MLPSWRPGSKTNFVVAKLYVHFYAAVVLGCVDDRITNITQKCIKLTIPWMYGSSKCLLPHQNPGSKWENMVAFATKIPRISSPAKYLNELVHAIGTPAEETSSLDPGCLKYRYRYSFCWLSVHFLLVFLSSYPVVVLPLIWLLIYV